MNTLKSSAISLLLYVLGSAPALAVVFTGAKTLTNANVSDVYELDCPAGATGAKARVDDTATTVNDTAQMHLLITKFGKANFAIDATENGTWSGWKTVNDNEGTYTLVFSRTAGGNESYRGEAECLPLSVPESDWDQIP